MQLGHSLWMENVPFVFAVCHVITLDSTMNVYNSMGVVYVVAYEWYATFYSKLVSTFNLKKISPGNRQQ